MATLDRGHTHLGELVVAAFDEAALHSRNAREVSRLATRTVVAALMEEWGEQIPGKTDTASAWTRLISQCGGASSALFGETTGAVRRAVLGGRATW